MRNDPQHLISSKLAAWYTLDRMVELARARNPLDLDAVRWREAAKEVRAWLEANALRADGGLSAVAQGLFAWADGSGPGPCKIALEGPRPGADAPKGTAAPVQPPIVNEVGKALGKLFGR